MAAGQCLLCGGSSCVYSEELAAPFGHIDMGEDDVDTTPEEA